MMLMWCYYSFYVALLYVQYVHVHMYVTYCIPYRTVALPYVRYGVMYVICVEPGHVACRLPVHMIIVYSTYMDKLKCSFFFFSFPLSLFPHSFFNIDII